MKKSLLHVSNINKALKNAKSEVLVNFIRSEQSGIMVVTNKVMSSFDLLIIKNYVKNVKYSDILSVDIPHLLQSKSYLKIIGIPYYLYNNSQVCLLPSNVEKIIKQSQIFDNIVLASKLQVIKVSPKSYMSIVWVDIWDVQSRSRVKSLINQCFNIEKYITTIRGINMNLGILQYKNCWK